MAKGKNGESKMRRTYLLKLVGELITGEPMMSFTNHHIERGRVMEAEARHFYSFMTDAEPAPVGFIRNGNAGASPDALLGKNGLLEIKTALPHILIDLILKDQFPAEHKAQCQGQLWIAQREWLDLIVYWPKLPLFVKRITRDEDYIEELSSAVDQFNDELHALAEKIAAYGRAEAA